jgi:hypothetical protein
VIHHRCKGTGRLLLTDARPRGFGAHTRYHAAARAPEGHREIDEDSPLLKELLGEVENDVITSNLYDLERLGELAQGLSAWNPSGIREVATSVRRYHRIEFRRLGLRGYAPVRQKQEKLLRRDP